MCACFQETLLVSKEFIAFLHTLSAYNSLIVRYKVYSSDLRECLCTSLRYAEAYENCIDPVPCRRNPTRKRNCHIKLSAPSNRRKLHWNKSVAAKVWFLLLKKLHWNKRVAAEVSLEMIWRKRSFETENLSQPCDNKSWY